ncbi:hypothetical protein JY97_06405 [Alkalispirochaeta odontotermitis]|nr:hypothetical protein JY97_06405 [Alkalispirochaeta odontotermitis]CAB1077183.1 hypothetical protein D1AOALGA4SA_4975 [Olavius algarvensis Delta 1 endosymbiont]
MMKKQLSLVVHSLDFLHRFFASMKLLRNRFDFIFLDRIYKIDGIVFAFGEEPYRSKAVLSR